MPNIFDQFDPQPTTAAPNVPAAPITQNIFDQFDAGAASPVQIAAQSMSAAQAADVAAPQPQSFPPRRDVGIFQSWLEQLENISRGIAQRTNPNVYHGDATFLREPLGEITAIGDEGLFYGPPGARQLVNPRTDVVLRDPATGKLMAFRRNPEFDESTLTGLARFATQGLMTGPVVGPVRAAQTASAIAAQRATDIARDVEAFRELGVRPFGPAFSSGPTASVARQLTETPVIGGPVRSAMEESLRETGAAAENVASLFGDARTMREAGQTVQAGLQRFRDARPAEIVEDSIRNLSDTELSRVIYAPARETSLKTKQAALYERAWRFIPQEMQRGRAVEGLTRVMQSPSNTRAVLRDIIERNARMTLQSGQSTAPEGVLRPVQGGLLGRMLEAIDNPHWTANLQTLRDMRSELRRLASGMTDTERNTLRLSDLERLQAALTQDMIALLQRNADAYRKAGNTAMAQRFERAIKEFRRADQFTRLSMERLETVERLFNASSVESLSQNILQAARSGGRGNFEMLRNLSRVLREEEMDQVRAALIRHLGRPVGSARGAAQEIDFSVSTFLTNMRNMSPEAKSLLFGGEHRRAVENLERVVSRLANVEALANVSRSGTNMLNIGAVLGGLGAVASGADAMFTALVVGTGGFGLSVLFSRPSYVNWAARYAQLRAAALRAPNRVRPELIAHIRRLEEMARNNPDLLPVVRAAREDGIIQGNEDDQR